MNCTPETPMPKERDLVGIQWFHHGARPAPGHDYPEKGKPSVYRCPNCGHEFGVSLGRKVSSAEARQQWEDMKARGARAPGVGHV